LYLTSQELINTTFWCLDFEDTREESRYINLLSFGHKAQSRIA